MLQAQSNKERNTQTKIPAFKSFPIISPLGPQALAQPPHQLSSLTKRKTELQKVASHRILQILLQMPSILLLIIPLHPRHMHAIPVKADETRDEELVALFGGGRGLEVGLGGARGGGVDDVGKGVVEEHGVAGRAIDDAVQDVGYDFALPITS